MVDRHPRPIFPVGTRVMHPWYGAGTVVPPWSATHWVVDFDKRPPYRASSHVEFSGASQGELCELNAPTSPGNWGALIACGGVRPTWLADDEQCALRHYVPHHGLSSGVRGLSPLPPSAISWNDLRSFSLRADHPYYVATAQGFTYWPGGPNAPEDWDGGTVLLGDRSQYTPPIGWWHQSPQIDRNVIGYRRKTGATEHVESDADHTPHEYKMAGIDTCCRCGNAETHSVHSSRFPTPQQRETATLVAENDRLTKRANELLTANNQLVETNRKLRRALAEVGTTIDAALTGAEARA